MILESDNNYYNHLVVLVNKLLVIHLFGVEEKEKEKTEKEKQNWAQIMNDSECYWIDELMKLKAKMPKDPCLDESEKNDPILNYRE